MPPGLPRQQASSRWESLIQVKVRENCSVVNITMLQYLLLGVWGWGFGIGGRVWVRALQKSRDFEILIKTLTCSYLTMHNF